MSDPVSVLPSSEPKVSGEVACRDARQIPILITRQVVERPLLRCRVAFGRPLVSRRPEIGQIRPSPIARHALSGEYLVRKPSRSTSTRSWSSPQVRSASLGERMLNTDCAPGTLLAQINPPTEMCGCVDAQHPPDVVREDAPAPQRNGALACAVRGKSDFRRKVGHCEEVVPEHVGRALPTDQLR